MRARYLRWRRQWHHQWRCHWRRQRPGILLLAVLALLALPRAEAADGLTFSGQFQQTASVAIPLSGGAVAGGAATNLSLLLDGRRGAASFRASVHFAVLYGNEAATLWSSLLVSPNKAQSLLMTPAFDSTATIPDTLALLSIDDLSLRWDVGSFAFEAGKSYANWGVGKAFSPADFFAEFDYSSGTPTRLSKLIARATWFPGATSRIDLVYDPFAASGATIAARAYSTALDTLAFSLAAGIRESAGASPPNALGAAEVSFDLPLISPYGEAAFTMPLGDAAALSYSLLGGAMTRIGDATLFGEYLFSPNEATRQGVFVQAAIPLGEWLSLSAPALYYPESEILTTGITMTISDFEGMDFALAAVANHSASHAWSGKLSFTARSSF